MAMGRSAKSSGTTSATGCTRCPFFKSHSKLTIVCEGVVPDTRSVMTFNELAFKDVQKDTFCDGSYENCEMFRSIMRFKYLEDSID